MRNNPKVRLISIGIGGLVIIGGRIFVFTTLLTGESNDLRADIRQEDEKIGLVKKPTDKNMTIEKPIHINDNKKEEVSPTLSLEDVSEKKEMSPINILVPPHLNNQQLKALSTHIFEERGVLANIQLPKTWKTYEDLVQEEQHEPHFDIILTPSYRIEFFDDRGVALNTKQPITPLFHPSFASLIERKEATFIPFSLDPYITIYDTTLDIPKGFTIGHIQKILLKQNSPLYLPFLLSSSWLTDTMYPGYTQLVLRFIENAIGQEHVYALEYLKTHSDLSPSSIHKVAKYYATDYTQCEAFPDICLIATKHAGIHFGTLSTLEQLQGSFGIDAYAHGYAITHLPLRQKMYPYVGRGWIMNKKSPYLEEIGIWIKGYLQQYDNDNLDLRPHTFSAFISIYDEQRIQTRYQDMLDYPKSIEIIEGNIDDINTLQETTPLIPMLEGLYGTNIYIKELIRLEK